MSLCWPISCTEVGSCSLLVKNMGLSISSRVSRKRRCGSPFNGHAQLEEKEEFKDDPDILIKVKERIFPCHRRILVKNSGYFRTMFSDFEEKHCNQIEIKDIIEPDVMEKVIHLIYNGEISLKPDNVQTILDAAIYLQIDYLQNRCCEFIKARTDRHNCVSLYLYAISMGPFSLQCFAEDFIVSHFEHIIYKSKEFVNLSKEHLLRFISNDKLSVSSEGEIYRAVLRWVQWDVKNRSVHIPSLMEHVHFPLMSPVEIERSFRFQRAKKNKNLAITLQEARTYFSKNTDEKIDYWNKKAKPVRWPKIFVVMRMYWKNLPMEYYDFRTRSWDILCSVQNWRSCTALVAHGATLYLLGGEENDVNSPTGSRTVNRVTNFDCDRQKWSSTPSMQLARRWAGATVFNGVIYAIGGIGGRGGTYEKRLDSVECLDLRSRNLQWRTLSPMSTARSSHTVEILNGKIYVVGGGDGHEWLCSAEVYDIETNKWSKIANLKAKRWKCGLVVLGGYLYAVGGMDSPQAGFWGAPLKTVERYDPLHDTWTQMSQMNEARFGCGVVAYQGKVYVSGGFGIGKAILSSCECFDPDTNKWNKMNVSMKKMCGFVGGVLVDRPLHFSDSENCFI